MIWIIGIGGALGTATRFIVGNIINKRTQTVYPFPVGTWLINIIGSFLLGLITQLYLSNHIGEWLLHFGGVGFVDLLQLSQPLDMKP